MLFLLSFLFELPNITGYYLQCRCNILQICSDSCKETAALYETYLERKVFEIEEKDVLESSEILHWNREKFPLLIDKPI